MEFLQNLWAYNNWANQALIKVFLEHGKNLPPACLHLFSHIINTQVVWLSRLQGTPQLYGAWDDHTVQICKAMHEDSAAGLHLQIQLDAQELAEIISYKNSTGSAYQNSRLDILLHVFNHGSYHRAQIATQMRKNGLVPLNTDYITFKRE